MAEERIAFPNEFDHAIQAGPVAVAARNLVREPLVQLQAVELPHFLLVERAHTQVADLQTLVRGFAGLFCTNRLLASLHYLS